MISEPTNQKAEFLTNVPYLRHICSLLHCTMDLAALSVQHVYSLLDLPQLHNRMGCRGRFFRHTYWDWCQNEHPHAQGRQDHTFPNKPRELNKVMRGNQEQCDKRFGVQQSHSL